MCHTSWSSFCYLSNIWAPVKSICVSCIFCIMQCLFVKSTKWEVKFLLKSFVALWILLSVWPCDVFLGISEGVLFPLVHNDSLWHRGIDKCTMSDSLTCGHPIHHHHHHVDVQMLTRVHIEEVLSQTPACLLWIPIDQFWSQSDQTLSFHIHPKPSKGDLDGGSCGVPLYEQK